MHIYILLQRLMLCLCCVGWPAEENGGRIQEAQEGGRAGVPFTGVGPDGTENALRGVQHTGSRIFTGIDHKAEEICWVVWCLYILELKGTHSDCVSSCNSYSPCLSDCLCRFVSSLYLVFPSTMAFHIWHMGCIIMRQHAVYIHDLCVSLTFDPIWGLGGILSEFYSQFLSCFL